MPSIRPDQLSQLMQTMRTASISLSTRCLFMWQLLTITRPAEAAEARWDEIDFDANEWKIPAARMKMNRDHTVPLSDGALTILELMKSLSGGLTCPQYLIQPSVSNAGWFFFMFPFRQHAANSHGVW